MNSRGPVKSARIWTRGASGGVIVVVTLLLVWFLRGPGRVTGDADPAEKSGSADWSKSVTLAGAHDVLGESDVRAGGAADHGHVMFSGEMLNVVIDEHMYLVQDSGNETEVWRPVELKQLIEAAQQTTGDSNGIRVRIQKKVTSRASAEQRILAALQQAGISSDAVFESSELID